ncbi:putative disease resistance RPP13-like protein 3 [Mangifera indica]|uniref:putative disease resistance RPP13-like protein 3 n=1 Tax=Mangifera indica TaxID=29780 RepID=UPI001CFA289C|nr:putative disease resistance RPP13-like protein 3 [Mangifera indica]
MDAVVFSQRLRKLLAGDEGILPDEVKELLRRIQTDFEVMISFIRERQHNLIGNFCRTYESNPQIWKIKKQLIDYSHELDSAIDIILLDIMQHKSQRNSRVFSDAHDGIKITSNRMNSGEQELPTSPMCADEIEESFPLTWGLEGREDESFPDVDEIMKREKGSHRADQSIISLSFQLNDSSSSSSYTVKKGKMELFHEFERGHIYGIELMRCLMHEGEEIVSKLPQVNYSSPSSERGVKVQRRKRKLINNKPRLVGREEETKYLLDHLIEGDPSLSPILIRGTGGCGKTVLAAEVYNSSYVKNYFDCRAWIVVSYNSNIHKILDDMLKSVIPSSLLSDVMDKDFELKRNALRDFLTNKRYLIVLDDVPDPGSWKDFNQALPDDHNRSRVLITTTVYDYRTYWNACLEIKGPSEEDSQEILLDRVCIKEGRQLELDPVIKSLTKFYQGRPSAILCISGLLSDMDIEDLFPKLSLHCDEAENLDVPIFYWILSYSYLNLPLNLRPCFLYFAVFPEGFGIYTWHLYQLWISEGFIHDNSEATAEEYLKHLVDAGFVQVNKRTSGGRIKTCNINGYIRDLLISMARMEKFIQVHVKVENKPPTIIYRRLSIHLGDSRFVPPEYSAPYLSSLLCLGLKSDNLAEIDCIYLSENFKLLRVLDLGNLVLQQYPTGIQTLFLLSYATIF